MDALCRDPHARLVAGDAGLGRWEHPRRAGGRKAAVESRAVWETGARSCGSRFRVGGGGPGDSGVRGRMARPLVSALGLLFQTGALGPAVLEPHLGGQRGPGGGGVRGEGPPVSPLLGRWRGEAVQLRILPPLSLRPPDPIRGSWGSGGSGKGRRGQGQGLGTHGAGRGLPERLRGSEALRAGHRDTRGGGGHQAGRMRLAR